MKKLSLSTSSIFFVSLLSFLLFSMLCQGRAHTDEAVIHFSAPFKIVHEENRIDTVVIDQQEYIVPVLWQGKKIEGQFIDSSSLVLVPSQFVKNNGKIYLRSDASEAFLRMAEKAEQEGVQLVIDSGYRSVRYQRKIFKRQMDKGKSFEDIARYVAPPGYSEHVLGWAVDFSPSDWQFVHTEAYEWLSLYAGMYGFTETYPKNNPDGEPWEPSHWCFHPLSPALFENME